MPIRIQSSLFLGPRKTEDTFFCVPILTPFYQFITFVRALKVRIDSLLYLLFARQMLLQHSEPPPALKTAPDKLASRLLTVNSSLLIDIYCVTSTVVYFYVILYTIEMYGIELSRKVILKKFIRWRY